MAYASRILNRAEQNYSQIERESLAIDFGVIKFCEYLLGRHFKLLTDHELLITLLVKNKSVPHLATARIKRWSLLLAVYDYALEFLSGKDNVYANVLSRKPINGKPSSQEKVTVNVMFIQGDQIVNVKMMTQETKNDPVLREVIHYTKKGWLEKPEERFQPYYNKRLELTHEDGVLLLNSRVVIQESLRTILLKGLHAEHLGMLKIQQLAQKYLLWRRLDKEIEETIKLCTTFQETAKALLHLNVPHGHGQLVHGSVYTWVLRVHKNFRQHDCSFKT